MEGGLALWCAGLGRRETQYKMESPDEGELSGVWRSYCDDVGGLFGGGRVQIGDELKAAHRSRTEKGCFAVTAQIPHNLFLPHKTARDFFLTITHICYKSLLKWSTSMIHCV